MDQPSLARVVPTYGVTAAQPHDSSSKAPNNENKADVPTLGLTRSDFRATSEWHEYLDAAP